MKTVLSLLLAMLAIKTTTTTSATGQEACSKGYIACLDKCVGRPSAAMQETCMRSRQSQHRLLLAGVWRTGSERRYGAGRGARQRDACR